MNATPVPNPSARLRLLVVEDDLPTLELLEVVLDSLDFEVVAASDSPKALEDARALDFDGIFLDYNMPKITGLELLQGLRKIARHRKTPVVIITASDDNFVRKSFYAAGAHFFLQKPIDRQKITRLVGASRGAMVQHRDTKRLVPLAGDVKCEVGGQSSLLRAVQIGESTLVACGSLSAPQNARAILTVALPGHRTCITTSAILTSNASDGTLTFEWSGLSSTNKERIRDFVHKTAAR